MQIEKVLLTKEMIFYPNMHMVECLVGRLVENFG